MISVSHIERGKKRHGHGILIHSQSVSQPILELEWAINSWKHEKMRIFILTYLWSLNFIYFSLVKLQSRQMQLKIICFLLNRISKWIQLWWQRLQGLICIIWIELRFVLHFIRSQENHSHANWRLVHLDHFMRFTFADQTHEWMSWSWNRVSVGGSFRRWPEQNIIWQYSTSCHCIEFHTWCGLLINANST